ncbi:MAG: hypothetical protein AB9866_29550 [Syntrophobacteraceae bacterium]
MPEKCRLSVCGFDPMIVRGYLKTGARALWWYLPDDVYEDFKVKSGDTVIGKLLAVYNPKGEQTAAPNENFRWLTTKETGYAVQLPSEAITKYELTEFHFVELEINHINEMEVYPGETKQSKWWPTEKMKLSYSIAYIAP